MSEISSFRGLAGEVCRGFMFKRNIPTVLVMTVIIGLLLAIIDSIDINFYKIPWYLLNVGVFILPIFFIARFAIPASRGNIHCEFFSGELDRGDVIQFVARYSVLTLFWYVPTYLCAWLLNTRLPFIPLTGFSLSPSLLFNSGSIFKSIAVYFLNIINSFAPMMCILLACFTDNMEETLSLHPWQWLLERKKDLVILFAVALGTPFLFFILLATPVAVICKAIVSLLIKSRVNPLSAIVFITKSLTLICFSYLLMFTGRLSGAFVLGEDELYLEDEANAITQSLLRDKDTTVANAAAHHLQQKQQPQEAPPDINAIIKTATNTPEEELEETIHQTSAKAKMKAKPLEFYIALTYLYKKSNDTEASVEAASNAIRCALETKFPNMAMTLFKAVADDKNKVRLSAENWILLSDAFLNESRFMYASWCLYTGIMAGPDVNDISKQKKLIAIADKASEEGETKQAISIYQFFLNKFPDSTLAEYVQDLLTKLSDE